MEHHDIDIHPIPESEKPQFINEPWLSDISLMDAYPTKTAEELKQPEAEKDNVRVYVPLDINRKAILRRLRRVISRYGEANENNEINFSMDVEYLVSQIEIYDQIWSVRHMPEEGNHSAEAIALVKEFVSLLEEIPDGCSEYFPFDVIDDLREEYLE